MLSDRERATWDEIQDQLVADDPEFVRAFDAPIQCPPSTPPKPTAERRVHQILPWSAVILGVLLLMTGSVAAALLVAIVGVAASMARLRGGSTA